MAPVKILVVEDDMIIAADISLNLTNFGFEVTGILPKGEATFEHIEQDRPDLILMDVSLKGELDGVETAKKVHESYGIPIIFLTANSDNATFERAKDARPYAFITKPFNPNDLKRAIELAISRLAAEAQANGNESTTPAKKESEEEGDHFILDDRIFIRHKDRLVRIDLDEIYCIEAESNYSKLVTEKKEYLLAITLKAFGERLKHDHFVRVHRSYIININKLEEVGEVYLRVAGRQIPISKSNKDTLYKRLKLI